LPDGGPLDAPQIVLGAALRKRPSVAATQQPEIEVTP
jgi:hypothetical protein